MLRVALACVLAAFVCDASAQQRASDCALEEAGNGTVRAVLDGRTLVLTDGREIRLAAIEVSSSHAALEKLLGRNVVLRRLGDDKDRHGRVLAHAFAGSDVTSVQQNLLASGYARVASHVGDAGCARQLLNAERTARAARLGIWSEPSYAPRQAAEPASVLAERGRFTLVEGKVVSVRESGGTIYVNFGRRWSEDFTATVARRDERTFTTAGVELRKLAGRNVRVRGFVEERGGPWLEVTRPEQIEIADGN